MKKLNKSFFLQIALSLVSGLGLMAQPANDNCNSAISLISSVACNQQTFDNTAATQSLSPAACGGFTSTSANDVWFSFVAVGSGDSVIVTPSGVFDAVVEVFSGSCTSPLSIACSDIALAATEKVAPGNLLIGNTYRIRVYGWNGSQGQFSICIKQSSGIPSGPVNDNCATATTLISGASCSGQLTSSVGATQSQAPSLCGGFTSTSAQDVWFKFTAATAGDSLILTPSGGFDGVLQLFSGSCGSLLSIVCSDNAGTTTQEKLSPGTLTQGQTYYARVYGWGGSTGSFTVCVKQPSLFPANDNCGVNVLLTPGISCNSQTYSNINATQSLAPGICGTTISNSAQDVWFAFGAITANDTVIVSPIGNFNPVVEVFSGICGNPVSIGCSNSTNSATATERVSPGGLSNGILYWVRVYGYNGSQGQFSICVKQSTTTTTPPANDNCQGAISLTPSVSCGSLTYSNAGGTQSLSPVACSGATSASARDVWFSFVASNAGDSIIVTPTGTFDPIVQLFGGSTCSTLVSLTCSDDPNIGTAIEKISFGGLSVGTTYRVRVYGWNGIEGQFSICIKQPSGSAPANDNCTAAITLSISQNCNPQTFTTVGATQSLAPTSCGGIPSTSAQDVWFKFGPVLSQNDSVIVSPVGGFNPVVEFYSGVCSNLTSLACSNNPFNPAAVEKVSPGNLNLSMIYYVRVYGFNGSQGQFNICVKAAGSPPSTNDNCANATEVSVTVNCLGQIGTTVGASQSLAPASCNGATSSSALDVWYRFTAGSPGDSIKVAGDFNSVIQLYSGTCSNLVSVACANGLNAAGIETISPGNLVPGQIYYFRVYGFNGSSGNFAYCVKSTLNCNTIAGTISVSPTETVSNAIAILNLTGSSLGASVQWQVSEDNFSWTNSGTPVTQTADTFYITSQTTQTYYVRARVTVGTCTPANSNSAPLLVSCATPFTNKEPALSGFGISAFSFAGISNPSFNVAPSGAYQNFRSITGQVCRGESYPYTITSLLNNQSVKAIWIDFNNNGSFSEPGETVLNPIAGIGNLSGNIIIPSVATPGTVRMRIMLYSPGASSPSANPCFAGPYAAGEIEEYSLNISAAPTTANAGANASICNSTYTLSANSPLSGTGQWTVVSGTGTFSNAFSPIATVSGLSAGSNIFRWTISTACTSSISQVTITSTGTLTANAGLDQTVCGGQVTVSANTPSAGSGVWTVVSGSGIFANSSNPVTQVTGLASGSNIFRWTVSNPPCTPVSDDVQVTNLGGLAVTAQAGSDQTICSPTASLAGNSSGNGTGVWTLVAGSGIILNPSSPTASVSSLGTGNNVFRWTITNGNCPASFDDVSVIREANPSTANAGTDQVVCAGQTQLSAIPPSTGIGNWIVVTGSGQISNPLNPNTTVSGLSNGINVFRWTVYNGVCSPNTDDVIISTNLSAVVANAGADQVICSTDASLSANNPGSGTGLWTLVSGSGSIASPASANTTVTGLGTGINVFRWTVSSPGCSPSSDEVSIARNAQALAAAGSDQQLCTNQATMAAISPSTGTGTWSLISGSGTIINPNSPVTQISGLGNGVNVFRWTVSNLPCPAVFDEVSISTNLSAVAANAGPDQSICGFTVQLNGNNPGSGTGTWALVQGSGGITSPNNPTLSVSGLATGINVFSWTINPGGSCTPTVDLVTITTFDVVLAVAGTDQSVCGNTAALSGNNPGSAAGTWTLVSGSGELVNPASSSSQVINLGSGFNVFRWTISNAPCPASSDDVSISSTPSGLLASAGADQTVCGTSANLNALVPGNGNGSWSLVSGTAQISQTNNPVSAVTSLSAGANTFLWTVTSGACNASDLVTITREPDLLDLGSDTLLCEGEAISLSAGGTYAAYLWSDNSNNQNILVNSSGQYWLQVVSLNGCIFVDTIQVVLIPCTGIEDVLAEGDGLLKVFPNPSEGKFSILNTQQKAAQTEFRVISGSGRQVYFRAAGALGGNNSFDIDLQGMPPGLYLLEARSPSGRMLEKLMLR